MSAPHILPMGVRDAERILEERRADELRAVLEAIPVVREFTPGESFVVMCHLRNRLLAKGYHVRMIVSAKGGKLEIRGGPLS